MIEEADLNFLHGSDLFANQPEEVLKTVLEQGDVVSFGPGEVVFEQGAVGDRLFIVKDGVLGIVATPTDSTEPMTVAFLGRGEVLGELALLTGSPRSATVRSPEHAELFTIEQAVFLDLMGCLPAFARNLCVVLAKRLETTTLKIPSGATKQLQGNLKFFALATVIQTLIGSHQSGVLSVTHSKGLAGKQKIAEILFIKGNISRAKFKHLTGDDTVFQLFQARLEGEFSFGGKASPEEEGVQSDITMPAISLLMESVRLQDELPLLLEKHPDASRVLRRKVEQLAWEDEDTAEVAAAIWARLKSGASLADLEADVARCTYSICKVVDSLITTEQVA